MFGPSLLSIYGKLSKDVIPVTSDSFRGTYHWEADNTVTACPRTAWQSKLSGFPVDAYLPRFAWTRLAQLPTACISGFLVVSPLA